MKMNFWELAKKESDNYETPCVINEVLGLEKFDIEKMKNFLEKLLYQNNLSSKDLRFFINSQPKHDMMEINNHIKETLRKTLDEGILPGDDKFCLVVNKLEKFYDILPQEFKNIFDVSSEHFNSFSSFQVILFAGNYGFTPFGFHRDGQLEIAVHFNLGPYEKEFYIVDSDIFIKVTGSTDTCKQIDCLLPYATKHVVPVGSAFILPTKHYHIGNSENLSFDIVLLVSRFTLLDYIRSSIDAKIESSLISQCELDSFFPKKLFYTEDDLENAYKVYQNKFNDDSPYLMFTFYAYIDYLLSSYSNNGYQSLSAISHMVKNLDIKDLKIKLVKPFRIYSYLYRNKVIIFLRRKKVTINYSEEINILNQELNSQKIISVFELINRFKDLELKLMKYVQILLESGCVEQV